MTHYAVGYRTEAFTIVHVEADSADEAREIADEQFAPPRICARCSGWGKSDGEQAVEIGDDWEQDESEIGVWEA